MIDIEKVKQALKDYEWISDKLAYWSGHDISELDDTYNYSNNISEVYDALNELERLQHKPTAEEVRKAIEDELKRKVIIVQEEDGAINFDISSGYIVKFLYGGIKFDFNPSPKLAIMIAKFYEVE